MADLIQLKTAKYKGVELLFREILTTGGNRVIKFRYPGSDKQSVEVQGRVPKTFNMTIIIPHDDYYAVRENTLRVLDDGVPGVFVHPTFGDLENVINGEYSLIERISELGRAEITVPFEINDATGIPIESGNLASQVKEESNLLNELLNSDLADGYNVSLTFPKNFEDAISNLSNITDSFDVVASTTNAIAEKASAFRSQVLGFSGRINSLIQSPADMVESLLSLFESVDNLFETPGETFGALSSLFNFGSDDPVVTQNTVGRIERKTNRDLIRANMRVQALSYAYTNAALDTYNSTDELDNVQETLELQYLDARDNQMLSNEALEQLDRVRVQAQKTLDNARVNTRSIITIETERKPLSVLLYQYYGNTDLFDVIAELNNVKMNAFVEGNVRILVT